MKSALFVDFDNVYTQLRQLQPDAAERFARHPIDWIRWLTEGLQLPEPHEADARRRLLVRRCYLNPNWYQNYRYAFLRAGFEIVDCPPVTSQGKTSTDIHMVLDIIDLLQHETQYGEFIVFSADADFTPVLRKLRRHDRRTTVLAIGFPSAAYQASADLLIDERQFLQRALGIDDDIDAGPDAPEPAAPTLEAEPGRPESAEPGSVSAGAAPLKEGAPAKPASRRLTDSELGAIGRRIVATVAQSATPVAASRLASLIREVHPQLSDDWNGSGTFKQFVKSLDLPSVVWSAGSGGRLSDASRQPLDPPALPLAASDDWDGNEAMFKLARQVAEMTGAPLLGPRVLQAVLRALAADVAAAPFEFQATADRVCERLADQQCSVGTREVAFLIRGMQLNGHVFGQGRDDVATLAQRAYNQILFLCEREQMVLDAAATELIQHWIGSSTP